jgi:hypothetical protein
MKNALKFLATVATVAALWYVTIGWRTGTEPVTGGFLVKAMVDYHQR